ncbi:uncharacterized protein LOC132739878 [Ruditapes philippinarum]|uniref:uncharacterized protein LOC132739878 n=1 Tax=Ruditapes philippinarum TaxID=129788 RepID=UPI00295AD170|nr:uncharacterized protein LOC132739878 [Ruditapes philippinarum]
MGTLSILPAHSLLIEICCDRIKIKSRRAIDTLKMEAVLIYTALLCWISCQNAMVQGTTCYREESLGDRDGNVYICDDESKPECCEENEQFTCCESQSKKTWKEQLILWGTVGGLVLLVSLTCCYFWRDNVCSKSDTSLAHRCCTCCKKVEKEDQKPFSSVPEPGSSRMSHFSPKPWRFAGQGINDDDRDSPAPAFHFKQPTYKKY